MTGGAFDESRLRAVKDHADILAIVGAHVTLKRRGRLYWGCCPFHGEKTPSFMVDPRDGHYHCYSCKAHGDAIDAAVRLNGWGFAEAVRNLAGKAGLDLADPHAVAASAARRKRTEERLAAERAREEAERTRLARDIFRRAYHELDAGPTGPAGAAAFPADTYLRVVRGIDPDKLPAAALADRDGELHTWPPTLRWTRAMKYAPEDDADDPQWGTFWPGIVAPLQRYDPASKASPVVAVHRTFLREDGTDKAPVTKQKLCLGPPVGAAIRFGPPGRTLGIAEGIETALSVLMARPEGLDAVWAAGSLSWLDAVVLPPEVQTVVLLMDNDLKDPKAAEDMLHRAGRNYRGLQKRNVRVVWPPKGTDFNDVLRGLGQDLAA